MIKFGVESGDQCILDAMKKGTTLEDIRRIFRWCNELGLDTHAHVMLGNVGETRETIERTIEFVKELNPSNAAFGILTPYPGTELFDRVAQLRPEINDGSQCDLKILHTANFFNETLHPYRSRYIGKLDENCLSPVLLAPKLSFESPKPYFELGGIASCRQSGHHDAGFQHTRRVVGCTQR